MIQNDGFRCLQIGTLIFPTIWASVCSVQNEDNSTSLPHIHVVKKNMIGILRPPDTLVKVTTKLPKRGR